MMTHQACIRCLLLCLVIASPAVAFTGVGVPRSSFGAPQNLAFRFGKSSSSNRRSSSSTITTTTQLYGIRTFIRNRFGKDNDKEEEEDVKVTLEPPSEESAAKAAEHHRGLFLGRTIEDVDICVVGGGVSGLLASITAAEEAPSPNTKIVLLESTPTCGGRVQSDTTEDGYVLDRGFAVFIEEYPVAKEVLNYTKLELGSFLPGALVKLKDDKRLARVSDPLRDPMSIVDALIAPVGTLADKVYIAPLLYHVRSKTVQELFDEHETDTYTCLREKWGFGTDIIDRFFKPFLEGIYLAPLEEQSSRMFHFVFKMFSEGAATLPAGGIGAVSQQLEQKARDMGVEIRTNQVVNDIHEKDEQIMVQLKDSSKAIRARSVVLATDGQVAKKMLSSMDGYESLTKVPENPQRAVGCLYYAFNTSLPVSDPILILSGYCEDRGTEENPINNVCFPSVVSNGYAPDGCNLCSVTVMKSVMEAYKGRYKELDEVVRKELCDWFPFEKDDIMNSWELKGTYYIRNAQPAQLSGPLAANVNGGRDCTLFAGTKLPPGIVVCGDHVATATLNGALESGINAGKEAARVAKAAEYEHSNKESKTEDRVVVPVI